MLLVLGATSVQLKEQPTPQPDGISRKFVFRYPLATKPSIFINDVEVLQDDIGVNGVDTGKKYYWNKNSRIIIQDDSQQVLTSTDKIEMDYKGFYNLFSFNEDINKINERKNIESSLGTSGKYEDTITVKEIETLEETNELSKGLLEKYGEVADKISFKTEDVPIEAGTMIPITKSLFQIDDTFLIYSVNIAPIGNKEEYTVKALDGAAVGGWEEFFKGLINENEEYIIGDELQNSTTTTSETTSSTGIYQITINKQLVPSTTLTPSTTLQPGTSQSETEELDDY